MTINIQNFKNISSLNLEVHPSFNIIFGDNAQGKTNVLESIYLLSGEKSFKKTKEKDMPKLGSSTFSITGLFKENREHSLTFSYALGKKKFLHNHIEKKSAKDILGKFPCILFYPDHLSIIKASPEERRSFLDEHIYQIKPKFLSATREYQKVLKQKNHLLKQGTHLPSYPDLLSVYNRQLAKLGTYIHCTRFHFLKEVFSFAKSLYAGISNQQESLSFSYTSSVFPHSDISFTPQWELHYFQVLSSHQKEEEQGKTSLFGIHKDDIVFFVDKHNARTFASQGQQRSIIIVLKLAIAQLYHKLLGTYPIVLLDDVMSELDENRMFFLFHQLLPMQVFITCCNPHYIQSISNSYQLFHIHQGKILP